MAGNAELSQFQNLLGQLQSAGQAHIAAPAAQLNPNVYQNDAAALAAAQPKFDPSLGGPFTASEFMMPSPGAGPAVAGTSAAAQPLWKTILTKLDQPRATIDTFLKQAITPTAAHPNVLKNIADMVNPAFWGNDAALLGADLANVQAQQAQGQPTTQFSDVLNQAGWSTPKGSPWIDRAAHGVTNFIGDVATDPLTYVTAGAGSLAKVGEKAAQEAATHVATTAGIDMSKAGSSLGSKIDHITGQVYQKMKNAGADEGTATKVANGARNQILNAGRAARAQAQHAAVSLNIPFTNLTKTLIEKPRFFKNIEPMTNAFEHTAATGKFDQLGLSQADRATMLNKLYGKNAVEDLSKQQISHLMNGLDESIPGATMENVFSPVEREALQTNQKLLNPALKDTLKPPTIDAVETPMERASALQNAMKGFEGNPFVADAAGRSKIGNIVANTANNLGVAPRLSAGGNAIWDAARQAEGLKYNGNQLMAQLNKAMKGLSSSEREAVSHTVEDQFPLGDSGLAKFSPEKRTQIKAAAQLIQNMNRQMAEKELGAGSLDHTINNYMFHKLNNNEMTPEEVQKWLEDAKFVGKSSVNKSNIARKGFKTLADWKDAINNTHEAVAKATDPEAQVKLESQLDRLRNLYESDPEKIMAARMARHVKTVSNTAMQQQLVKEGLVRSGVSALKPEDAKNFTQLSAKDAKTLGLKGTPYVHKDVSSGLQKVEDLFTDSKFNKVIKNLETLTNIWKPLAILRPSHFFTRGMGDVTNAMLAGASIGDFKNATKLFMDAKAGKLSGNAEKVWQEAIDNGILGSHSNYDVYSPTLKHLDTKLGKVEQAVNKNPYSKAMYAGLNTMDNISRLAVFLKGRNTYGNAKQAANLVRKYLFNYNELSGTDRAIRLVVPFWNWTKRNLPLMISEFARQPRYFQTFNRIQQNLQGDQSNNLVPEWGQDYWRLPGGHLFLNPKLPLEDMTTFDPNVMDKGGLGSALSSVNPFMMMPFEVTANQDFFTGMPIDKYKTQNQGYNLGTLLKYLAEQTVPPAQLGSSVASSFNQGSNTTPLQRAMTLFPGKPQNFDPAKVARENAYELSQEKKLEAEKRKAQAKSK